MKSLPSAYRSSRQRKMTNINLNKPLNTERSWDIYTVTYRLILSAIACLFAVSIWGMTPSENPGSINGWASHFQSLSWFHWLWVISIPTYIFLIYLRQKRDFARYFLKMFGVFLAIMALPTFYFIREAFDGLAETWVVVTTMLLVWICLGLIGAYWMAWGKFLKRRPQKTANWKRFEHHGP